MFALQEQIRDRRIFNGKLGGRLSSERFEVSNKVWLIVIAAIEPYASK
jgi:hypothetical protein